MLKFRVQEVTYADYYVEADSADEAMEYVGRRVNGEILIPELLDEGDYYDGTYFFDALAGEEGLMAQ